MQANIVAHPVNVIVFLRISWT